MVSTARLVETLGGTRVLKAKAPTPADLQARVRSGLPYAALETVAAGFAISREDLGVLLHVPPRTLARRKREKRLHADESDRLLRVGRIAALAEDVLGDRAKAVRWLHASNRALGDVAPLRCLDSDLGARQVEDVLLRIAHGTHS